MPRTYIVLPNGEKIEDDGHLFEKFDVEFAANGQTRLVPRKGIKKKFQRKPLNLAVEILEY